MTGCHRPDDSLTSCWSWASNDQAGQAGQAGQHSQALHQFSYTLLFYFIKWYNSFINAIGYGTSNRTMYQHEQQEMSEKRKEQTGQQ